MKGTLRRELEVMFSKGTQPIWFRITKWTVFIGLAYLLHGTKWFWVWVGWYTHSRFDNAFHIHHMENPRLDEILGWLEV